MKRQMVRDICLGKEIWKLLRWFYLAKIYRCEIVTSARSLSPSLDQKMLPLCLQEKLLNLGMSFSTTLTCNWHLGFEFSHPESESHVCMPSTCYLNGYFLYSLHFHWQNGGKNYICFCRVDQIIQGQNLSFKTLRKCSFTLLIEHILDIFLKPWPLLLGNRSLASKKPRLPRNGFRHT